jgi:hypothetical protein
MKMRPLTVRVSTIAISLLAGLDLRPHAAGREEFQVWGTAGPQFPSPPAGWREEAPDPVGLPALTPTAAEQRQGCVAFARDPFSEVDPGAMPAPTERVARLLTFATRGEYEPITLAIHALEDLRTVRVHVGELRGADGSAIPADHLDVRLARSVRVTRAMHRRQRPFRV